MIKSERIWLIFWATLQGFCLLMLHNLVVSFDKPGEWFVIIWPLYILALMFPLSMQILSGYRTQKALWFWTACYVLLAAGCAAYAGKVVWADELANRYAASPIFLFGSLMFTSWFVLMPFAEHRFRKGRWNGDYGMLCAAAWGNLFKLSSAALFVGIFWILLWLWAGLFQVLGVGFFEVLFGSRHFAYPVTAIAFGIGLSLYSAKEEALLGLYRATLNLLGWLLPLVSAIILLFMLMLPVQGIALLWKTGHATALMLGLQGLMVFLFNAAWQDGVHGIKFPGWIRKLMSMALLTLPILSVLCIYSLWLRVDQYGWTADRVWAAILTGLLALYAIGYAISVLRYKTPWMEAATKVNVYVALTLVVVLLSTMTPLLDPVRISVNSQLDRLLTQKVEVQSFDFQYLRFSGGWHGQRALKRLESLTEHPDAKEIQEKSTAALAATYRSYGVQAKVKRDRADWEQKLQVFPQGQSLTTEFLDFLWQQTENTVLWFQCMNQGAPCTVLLADLNRDGQDEVLIFDRHYGGYAFSMVDGQWQSVGRIHCKKCKGGCYQECLAEETDLLSLLEARDFSVVENQWQELMIGNWRYMIRD